MEKGIEAEKGNLYKQAEDVADNVLDNLKGMQSKIPLNYPPNCEMTQNIDYNKLFNILYQAFIKALNSCKLTLDEDGFARLVKNELYEVL